MGCSFLLLDVYAAACAVFIFCHATWTPTAKPSQFPRRQPANNRTIYSASFSDPQHTVDTVQTRKFHNGPSETQCTLLASQQGSWSPWRRNQALPCGWRGCTSLKRYNRPVRQPPKSQCVWSCEVHGRRDWLHMIRSDAPSREMGAEKIRCTGTSTSKRLRGGVG